MRSDFFDITILSSIIILYLLFATALLYKRYNLLVGVYITFIYFYDYLFINASYFLSDFFLNILKPLNEYLMVIFLMGVFKLKGPKISINALDKLIIYYLLFPSIVVILITDSRALNISNLIQGIRTYLLPIIVPYLMYKRNILKDIKLNKIINLLFLWSLISVLFAYYQKITFNGNLRDLWFYDFFNQYAENPVDKGPFNFIRDEELRATSFFVSPIIYSFSLSFPIILIVSLFLYGKQKYSKLLLLVLFVIFVYGQIIAETRIGLFISVIGLGILVLMKILRNHVSFIKLFFLPVFGILATFLYLVFGFTSDPSALGRLKQYSSFSTYFQYTGLGFGNENVLTHFDTYYMSIAVLFGGLVVFILVFYWKLFKYLHHYYHLFFNDYLLCAVFAFGLTFIYAFAFQFTAGSYSYRLLFFLIFLVFTLKRNNSKLNGKVISYSNL